MSRPAIGVTASLETMRSGAWVELTAGTPFAYCQAIQRAGGRAVILVPDPADSAAPEAVIATLQGLIVTGSSSDLDPALYGAPAHEATMQEISRAGLTCTSVMKISACVTVGSAWPALRMAGK